MKTKRCLAHPASQNTDNKMKLSEMIEIFEAAKQKNTIACLGTGTGKTFIAVMLIRENANEVRKPFDEGGKRIFFVVPTIPLVFQQAETIENHTDLVVGRYYRKISLDFWTDEFRKNEVLVMTPDIFKDIVEKTFILLRQIKLLILDECHHTLKDHPYRQAMKCFIDLPQGDMPRIFGLTASLLNSKCKPYSLEKKLKDLEKNLRSTVVTVNDLTDLQKYGTDPKEYIVLYRNYELKDSELLLRIEKKINEANIEKINMEKIDGVTFFEEPLKCLKSLSETLKDLGPWFAYKAADIFAREVERLLNRPFAANCLKMLDDIHSFLKEVQENCRTLSMNSDSANIDSMPHKIKRLLDIFLAAKRNAVEICGNLPGIQDFPFDQNPVKHYQITKQNQDLSEAVNFCSIVFVKQRITAYVLYQWLLDIKKKKCELDFLKPEFVVGHGVRYIAEISMFEKLQQKKLKDFREKRLNVLVATRVLEEGIDIRQCNLVVRFDLPDDYRSYVQSKGRARAKNSNYVLLIKENDMFQRFMHDLVDFKTIEKLLQSKCQDRTMPTEEEISAYMADSPIPPYMPRGPDGPRITLSSAISLVNRYCASLPSDMATKLMPQWSIRVVDLDNNQKEYECTLRMPINSPLRQTIVSTPMRRKKLAKMCAALKACQLLDEKGELNEHLMPISRLVDNALEKELGEIEEEDGKGAIPGTNRRRQVYDKHVPIFLKEVKPASGRLCYLNIINMMLVEPLPKTLNPRRRPLFDPAKTPRALALLCTVKLPSVTKSEIRACCKLTCYLGNFHPCWWVQTLTLPCFALGGMWDSGSNVPSTVVWRQLGRIAEHKHDLHKLIETVISSSYSEATFLFLTCCCTVEDEPLLLSFDVGISRFRVIKDLDILQIHQYYLEETECFELDDIDVPKALGDVFESVAGAIYLDSGMSLDVVWKVYYPWICPAMKHLCEHVPISPVRELHELVNCQKIFGEPVLKNKITYIEVTLPDGRKYQGVGPSKKIAKKSAAKRALADLKNSSRLDTS
ncbi:Endoribonuclease Dicer [Araneus ventricosus]|uniref:Endoribonuclease Dicer n=1 Tax=Araneus ventricosus TaxID=182803 RepID=A0A4Y2KR29_ARAVE|nr:Endoribonuclease Dicer [Araneus ventricosus]